MKNTNIIKKIGSDLFDNKNIYIADNDGYYRYLLEGIGLDKNILFIGINPSIATDTKYDLTTKKIRNFAALNSYSGWLLANIYPLRILNPSKIGKLNEEASNLNLTLIKEACRIYEIEDVCCCWGNDITIHNQFLETVSELVKEFSDNNFYRLGSFTKLGHPRHPSRIAYTTPLESFLLSEYISNFTYIL